MSSLATKSLLTHTTCMTVTKLLGDACPSRRAQMSWDSRRLSRNLDRISRGLHTKLPIHVREGLKWLGAPMQATKFASKGGIILHGHIPILTRWKDYKADDEKQLKIYIGKLAVCIYRLIYYHSSLHPFFSSIFLTTLVLTLTLPVNLS